MLLTTVEQLLDPSRLESVGAPIGVLVGGLIAALIGTAILFLLIRRYGTADGAIGPSEFMLGFPLAIGAFIFPVAVYAVVGDALGNKPLTVGVIQVFTAVAAIALLVRQPWRTPDEPRAEWLKARPKQLIFVPLIWIAAFPVMQAAMFAGIAMAEMTDLPVTAQQTIEDLRADGSPLWIAGWYVMAALAAPLAEEFIFRVVLFGGVRRALDSISKAKGWKHPGAWIALLVSVGLFVLAHGVWDWAVGIAPMVVLSLVLTWLYAHTRNMWPGVMFHALHNGFVVTMQFFVL